MHRMLMQAPGAYSTTELSTGRAYGDGLESMKTASSSHPCECPCVNASASLPSLPFAVQAQAKTSTRKLRLIVVLVRNAADNCAEHSAKRRRRSNPLQMFLNLSLL
eukprot:scaffold2249_cov272-Pinguiococcus_pyrenoidosus.AAC.8